MSLVVLVDSWGRIWLERSVFSSFICNSLDALFFLIARLLSLLFYVFAFTSDH